MFLMIKMNLIPQRIITGYRMVIDFRKLNKSTRKDHYPSPFIDQMIERLLKTLKKHRAAIGYTLDDLKGTSPTLCQHNISVVKDAKPVRDPQRWLNPKMKEVV